MSTVNSDVSGEADGRNADSSRGAVDSPKVAPGTELPRASVPPCTIPAAAAGFPFQQGPTTPLRPTCANGFGGPLSSAKKEPQRGPGKPRPRSTTSVCSKRSQQSCKSTATHIQEVAGDDLCATLLLACLFCHFSDLLPLLPGCFGSCPPLRSCNSVLLELCTDPRCCCRCCGTDEAIMDCCYQTGDCLELALEISELCYH